MSFNPYPSPAAPYSQIPNLGKEKESEKLRTNQVPWNLTRIPIRTKKRRESRESAEWAGQRVDEPGIEERRGMAKAIVP
jgi:hypothetical protein